jgi:hypothetical protein
MTRKKSGLANEMFDITQKGLAAGAMECGSIGVVE